MKKLLATTALIALASTSAFAGECGTHHKITKDEILAEQKAWGSVMMPPKSTRIQSGCKQIH